jgi:hypothetical protein
MNLELRNSGIACLAVASHPLHQENKGFPQRRGGAEGMLYFSLSLRLCASAGVHFFQQTPTSTREESELYYLTPSHF